MSKVKKLYDILSAKYDFGDYDAFASAMGDETKRRKIYDIASEQFDFGDYDSFNSNLGYTPSAPSAEEPQEETNQRWDERLLGKITNAATRFNDRVTGDSAAYLDTHDVYGNEKEQLSQEEIDQRAAMRQTLQDNGTIDRMEEMEKEARRAKIREFFRAGAMAMAAAEMPSAPSSSELADMSIEHAKEWSQNKAMEQTLDVALDKARAGEWGGIGENNVGNGVVDFGLGLWDSATRMSTWDFGVSDTLNGLTIAQVVKKWEENPDSLTATEHNLLDAMGMATAVQEAYQDQVGIGYAVGESLPQSAGFMASMYLNPASGLGKSLARQAVKKYGRQSISKNLARIGGDIAETAIMTATTGGGRVVADALERINGQSTYEIDPETGIVMYGGQEDQKTVGEAVVKAIGSNFIENYSEALGEYFDPLLGMSRRLAAGGLRKMNLDKWADALSDVQPSQMAASIRSLREKAKFGGVFGEIMEEEVGMALNAITVGDYTFSKEEADASNGKKQWIFDLENQLTTALSCAIMSGAMTGVETIGNVRYRREMERSVADAEKNARAAVGDEMIAQIDQASPEGMVDILRDAYMSQNLSLQQKRVLADYATQRVRMQYYNATGAKARRQVNVTQQNTIDAYETGRHAQLPQYYNINQEYRKSEAAINERENAEEIWDAIRLMNNMDENERQNIMRDFSEEDQELIRNWRYNAYRWQGAVNHRAEQVEDLVDEYRGQVTPYTRPDGTVTTAILGDNVVYVMSEAENGDAVVYTNDGRKIFCKMRDLEHVQQHNAEELIERFRDATTKAVNQETEKNLSYPSEVLEPAQGVTVETLDGKQWQVASTDGENVELVGLVFDKKSGQWIPNAGDYRKMTREQFMDWQKAELDRKNANTYEQGDELVFYVNGEPIDAEITGIDPEGNYYVHVSNLVDGLDKAVSDVYTAEELRKLTTPSSKMSEKTTENESTPTEEIKQSVSEEVTNGQIEDTVTEPTAEVAESVNTALSRVPKDAKGNPLYEQTDADTAWDAIMEQTEGDAEMAQRIADEMVADKKDALAEMQKGKPKKGATVAEKIANEKAHIAAIAQAGQEVAAWEKIAQTEARRREAAMSEAERYAAEMEQKNISEGLRALGEPQSLQEYVLAQLAGGAYKLRWNDKENGTKGFGSHTGLSTEEMKARLSMVDNKNGLTPEEIAHDIVENMDASFGEVDVMDVTDMVIDAVSTYASRRAMLNGMVEARVELIRQKEVAEQEAKDAWYMEQYHAAEEELAAYNEYLAEFAEEIYGEDVDYEQRIATFAEIQLEYDNQGTDAGLRSSADQGEGLASDREGGRSVGETEQLNQREVLGDAAGVAASEDQGIGSSVSAQSDVDAERDYREHLSSVIYEIESELGALTADNAETYVKSLFDNFKWQTLEEADDALRQIFKLQDGKVNSLAILPYLDAAQKEARKLSHGLKTDRKTLSNGDVVITNYDSNGKLSAVTIERDGEVVSVGTYEDGALFERTDYDANGNATKVTRYKDGEVVSEQEYKDGKRKVTANYFEMAEEAQKKRKQDELKAKAEAVRDKLAELGFTNGATLPKGYKWSDGKKYGSKGETITVLVVGDDIYLRDNQKTGGFIPPFNINDKNHQNAVIKNFRQWPSYSHFVTELLDAGWEGGRVFEDAIANTFKNEGIAISGNRVTRPLETKYYGQEDSTILEGSNQEGGSRRGGVDENLHGGEQTEVQKSSSDNRGGDNRSFGTAQARDAEGMVASASYSRRVAVDSIPLRGLRARIRDIQRQIYIAGITEDVDTEYVNNLKEDLEYAKEVLAKKEGNKWGVEDMQPVSLETAEAMFKEWNDDADVKALFDRVFDVFKKFGIDIKFDDAYKHDNKKAFFDAADNHIVLPMHLTYEEYVPQQEKATILLHEMIHGVTQYVLHAVEMTPESRREKGINISKGMLDAANQLHSIYNYISVGGVYKDVNGMQDVHEMVSQLADPNFRAFLKEQRLWDKIVEAIQKLLGIPVENNALDTSAKLLDYILDNYDIEAYNKLAGGINRAYYSQSSDDNLRFRDDNNSELKEKYTDEQIFDAAKQKFGVTDDIREAGYILPDGSMLDFSGRYAVDGDASSLKGGRYMDHREVNQIAYDANDNETGLETNMTDFIERGAIRIHYSNSGVGVINLNIVPTKEQKAKLRQLISAHNGNMDVDFGNGWNTEHHAEYDKAKPTRILGDIDRYYSEGVRPEGNILYRDGAPFFSNAERAVENIKQQKATPEQWLAMIKKDGGLKAGEDKWMGLSDWLNEQNEKGVKTLTKDEVLQFIRENQIEIEEVEYGDNPVGFDELKEEYEAMLRDEGYDAAHDAMTDRYGDDFDIAFEDLGGELAIVNEEAAAALLGSENIINSTRLEYTTEGLDNKKEIAFVVPNIESWNQSDNIHFGDAGEGRAVAWVRFGETTDEDGNRVLVIDEVQSKRHDEGRSKGYKSEARLKELEREYDALIDEQVELTKEILHDAGYAHKSESEGVYNETMQLKAETGLIGTDEQRARYNDLSNKLYEVSSEQRKLRNSIPDAPFDKNYHELVMKRMLRYAAENGFDKVAWNTGKQVAKRFGLSSKVSSIEYKPLANGHYNVTAYGTNGYPIEGVPVVYNNEQEIAETFGRGIAEKIVNDIEESKKTLKETNDALRELKERRKGLDEDSEEYEEIMEEYARLFALQDEANRAKSIEGEDLSIGGEDRVALYDEMIPRFMNKYTKKWGTKVGEVTLPEVEEAGRTMWSVDVTPEMRESVMQGQPMFREGMGAVSDREVSYENDPIAKWQGKPRYYGKRASAFAERERARMQKGVEEAAKILGVEVEIITDASTLKGRKAKAKGWYDINAKKVVVVIPNHVSKGDAVRTVLHEGVAHHGLRELFGDGFDAMLDNIYNNVAPELKARIDAIAERTGVSTSVATEEYLASLAEDTEFEYANKMGWWDKIKHYFVDMLRKLSMPGLNLKEELTDNELRYLLWRSYQNLVDPNSYLKPLGYLDDVAKQKELKVGNYAENTMATPRAAEMSEAEEWSAITMQRIEELEAQAAQLENEIADMEAKREADDASRYEMWDGLMMPIRMQLEDTYSEIEGLYTLSGEEEVNEEEREAEKQRQLYQKRIDNAYLKAVREGNWEEATDLFRQYVLSKAEDEGIVPMDYGVGYRGGAHSSIAKKVKEENPDAIAEAAYQMSIRIPKGSILVPMPSRTGNATYTVKLAEAIAKATDSEVRDVLKGKARMSVYEAKQKGFKMTPEDLGMYTTEELPKGKNIVIIDNVIDKGTTALAAVSAVKGASVVAYAYTLGDKQRVATLKLAEPVTYDDNKRIIPLSQRFNKESDDIRYRLVGGNSGYVGYSMSKRAAQARDEGRFPKTDFKKEYGVNDKVLDTLVKLGIINNTEWHHTSKFGNKTPFYGWEEVSYADYYEQHREEIARRVKAGETDGLVDEFEAYEEEQERFRRERLKNDMELTREYGQYREENAPKIPNEYNASNGVKVVTNGSSKHSDWRYYWGENEAFKKYARAAESELSDKLRAEDSRMSFTEWKAKRNSEEIIAEVERESANLGVQVRIARSIDELPDEDARKRAVDGQLKGYFDPRTGEVVVYEPNTDNASDAKRTVLHEIVGHKGLRQLIGEERYDKAMVQLMYMLPSEVRDAVLRRAERHGWNAAIAMDEYLAEQAERDVQPTWWGKVNANIRALLRNMGFNVMLTDADVTYLLWRSRKKLMGDTAFDMATNAILKQAARNSAEADAWNEQAFKDAEMRDFEKNELKQWRYRTGEAQNEYERHLETISYKFSEAYQDRMASLKVLQEAVEKESGKKIADWENAWMDENRMSSVNLAEIEMFREGYLEKIAKEGADIEKSGVKHQELIDYMFAKHGLERNEKMARAEAEEKAKRWKEKAVEEMQAKAAEELEKQNQSNAVIEARAKSAYKVKKQRLKGQLERGTISEAQYDHYMQMAEQAYQNELATMKTTHPVDVIAEIEKINTKAEQKLNEYWADHRDYSGLTALTGKDGVAGAEAAAMQMVSDFEAKRNTDLLWGALREANNEILRISYDAGIIDEETYNNLRDKYKYYIPLRGFAEKTAEDVYLYVDGHNSPYNAPIKTAKGRKSKADDPFAHIESMATSAIVEANRNRLKQKMLYMAERHHTDLMSVSDVWVESVDVRMDDGTTVQEWHTVFANIPDDATTEQAIQIQKAFEEDMEQKAKSDPDKYAKVSEKPNIPYRVVKQESGNQHQIVVKRGGKDVVIIVNGNPRAAQAVNGLTNRQATENKFIRSLRWVNRQLSANYTARNLVFMIKNLTKDSQYTKVMAFMKEPLSYGARFWRNWWLSTVKVPALLAKYKKTIRRESGGLDMSKPIERMFYEFISQGGETGYTHINTIEDYKKEMKLMILKHKGGIVGMGIKSWDALTGTLRGFNQWAEDTSRFAAYMTSRETGRSLTKSVNDAKEISVNFNRAGSGSRMVGEFSQSPAGYIAGVSAEACLIMWNFFNANVQGISNFYREAAKHPYKFAVVVGANMLYGFLHAMMASSGDDDEDKDNKYYDIPAWKRRMCHTIRIGDNWLCVPMAISFAPFYALGELAYSYFSGREKYTDAEIAAEVAKIAATAALPMDVTANNWWVPDAASPALEVAWFNEDWTGKPIYKERYDDSKPTWELAYKSTNPRLVAISKAINEATNKDVEVVDAKGNVTVLEDYKDRGWADNDFWTNAAGWEHMMEGYLGGNVKFVNDIAKSIQSVKNVDLRNVQTYPIINSFMMEGGEKVYVTRGKVYEAKKEIEEMKSKINSYGRETKDSDLPEADRKRAEELREALLNRDMQTIATFENLEKQRQSYQTKYDENPNAKEIISTYDKYNRPVGKKEVLVKDLLFDVMHKQLDVWDDYKFGEDYKPIISIGN